MTTVETANGAINADKLGVTLMHEHVFVLDWEAEANYPGSWDEEAEIANAISRIRLAALSGVETMVDLTVLGLGRNIPLLLRVAREVSVNIVVATGIYTFDEVPRPYRLRGPGLVIDEPDRLVDLFIRDITDGIAGTGVRAAIIKCATGSNGLTPGVERVVRAAGRASNATGAPISTHTDAGSRNGLDQQRLLRSEGVDLARTVIGHSGDTTDLDYLKELMDAGSFIGMDRFGMDLTPSFDERVDTVAQLCQLGYAERMVLSHDAPCFTHSFNREDRARLFPRWEFTHISDDVLPALRLRGVPDADITTMMVDNPRKILSTGGEGRPGV